MRYNIKKYVTIRLNMEDSNMPNKLALLSGVKLDVEPIRNKYPDLLIYESVNMLDAVAVAKKMELDAIEAIITTAGTADVIGSHINVPLVKISHTLLDLLETFLDVEEHMSSDGTHFLLIIHHSREIDVHRLKRFVKIDLKVSYYDDISDIQSIMEFLPEKSNPVIIGGATTVHYAKQYGFPYWPLSFALEAITVAVDNAYSLLKALRESQATALKMKTVLNFLNNGILITDPAGSIIDHNKQILEYLECHPQDISGQPISKVIYKPWDFSYITSRPNIGQLKRYNNKNFFISDYPIILENKTLIGSVLQFQEVEEIEKLEKKYREIKTAGFIAKSKFSDISATTSDLVTVIDQAKVYSQVDSTILIYGETGVGKELFAQSIHNYSARKFGPFVAINCAALPENLLESELMGYEEGAFTGARKRGKVGLIELAHNGTLFLDEVNHMPASIQARMLRIVQEKQVMRLGGERVIPADFRIISATNEDLRKSVKSNSFREDLFYRLNVLEVKIPPLRERKNDIPLLLEYFISTFIKKYGSCKYFDKTSLSILENYSWPGNIRELRNFTERYVVLSRNHLTTQHDFISRYIYSSTFEEEKNLNTDLKPHDNELLIKIGALSEMEKSIINQVLRLTNGNKNRAAQILNISRTSVWKKATFSVK